MLSSSLAQLNMGNLVNCHHDNDIYYMKLYIYNLLISCAIVGVKVHHSSDEAL